MRNSIVNKITQPLLEIEEWKEKIATARAENQRVVETLFVTLRETRYDPSKASAIATAFKATQELEESLLRIMYLAKDARECYDSMTLPPKPSLFNKKPDKYSNRETSEHIIMSENIFDFIREAKIEEAKVFMQGGLIDNVTIYAAIADVETDFTKED